MNMIQAEINSEAFGHVVKMLEKINRKASKIGAKPFSIENKTTFTKVVDKLEVSRTAFEVVGEIPVIAGWTPVANIDHVEGLVNGNAPTKYVNHANCEHCNQNRQRNITYILKNAEGELIQVGKTCLRDFLGLDPSAMLSFWSSYELIETFCKENAGYDGNGIIVMDLAEILCIATAVIKEFGFVSRKKSQDFGMNSTSGEVGSIFFSKRKQDEDYRNNAYANHMESVKTLIEWIKNKEVDPDNSYWFNLQKIADNEYTTPKSIGFAVSMIPTYFREMEVQREKESRLNEYFGSAGDKLKELELVYVKSVSFDTDFGTKHYHFFKDAEGRCFKWGTGNYIEQDADTTVKVSGTIKGHEEYKGQKQTVLTRAKIKAC